MTDALTVLVVEDDPHTLVVISALLTRLGMRFKRNTTGEGVLSQIDAMQPHPDVVLLDWNMSAGAALARQIAGAPGCASTAVVAMVEDDAQRAQVRSAGLPCLMRPLPQRELGAVLQHAVESKRNPGPPSDSAAP